MLKKTKKFGLLAACSMIIIGVTTAYATGVFESFKFHNNKVTVEVRTDQNINKEDAEKLAKEAQDDYNSTSTQETDVDVETNTFSSIEEVEENTGVKIVLPSYIPSDFQMEKDIIVENTFDDNYNIYISYVSEEHEEKQLDITIITQNQSEDSTVTTVTDAVHEGTYKSSLGTTYEILNEDGMTIMAQMLAT